jgi:polar amino acid transport system substrate-binding protein
MKRPQALSHLLTAGLIACAVFGSMNASARSLDEIMQSKTLIVGVNPNLPPLGVYDEKNEISGFDVAVAQKIADSMGVKLELVPIGSNDRVPFILSDKIDAVMGGMTRNADRLKVVDFTDPVNTEVLGILTTEGKPYKSWEELNDPAVRLVQVRGTTPIKLIQEKIPKAQLLILDNYPDAVRAISQGRADALIDVLDFMLSYTKNYSTKWRVVDAPIEVDYDCIGVQKGNTELTARLNAEIATLHKSGYIAESWKKWFGSAMLHDPTAAPAAAQ